MSNIWDNNIPRIVDGVTSFSAADMNPILTLIEQQLNALHADITGFAGSCGYITTVSGFSSECGKGTIVALGSDGLFVPAVAQWSADSTGRENLHPDIRANVVGVLISDVSTSGEGTLLCNGWTADEELINLMLVENGGTGTYYLSSSGGLINCPADTGVVVPCATVINPGQGVDSKLLFRPQTPEFQSHRHSINELAGEWEAVTPADAAVYMPNIDIVEASRLPIANSAALSDLLTHNTANLVLYINGDMSDPDRWAVVTISEAVYIYVAAAITSADRVFVASIIPGAGVTPIVRSIQSNSALLDVLTLGGDVHLTFNPISISSTDLTGRTITSITDSGISSGPVVHNIYAGVGTEVSAHYNDQGVAVPGCYDIHNKATLNTQLDFNITNLNGVLLGTDSEMVNYLFPADTTSALYGSLRIPYTSGTIGCRLNILARGTGAAIPNFTATIGVQHTPQQGESSILNAPINYTISGISETSDGLVYQLSSDEISGIQGNDHINLKLEVGNASTSVGIFAVSIELYTK